MKKKLFKLINHINRIILPRYSHKDPSKLNRIQQAIVAYRYYILVQSLD